MKHEVLQYYLFLAELYGWPTKGIRGVKSLILFNQQLQMGVRRWPK